MDVVGKKKPEKKYVDIHVEVATGTTFERVRKDSVESWRESDTDPGCSVVFLTSGRILKVTDTVAELDRILEAF
jgi:hypothetical protein